MMMGCPTLALLLAAASASAQYVPPDESQALLDPSATYPGECPCKDKALRIVKDKGLRGVGVWTANMLDYGPAPSFNDSSKVPQATRDMWTSISTVPFD